MTGSMLSYSGQNTVMYTVQYILKPIIIMIWYIIKILKYNGIFAQLAAKREKGLKFATFANFAKSSQKFFYLSFLSKFF